MDFVPPIKGISHCLTPFYGIAQTEILKHNITLGTGTKHFLTIYHEAKILLQQDTTSAKTSSEFSEFIWNLEFNPDNPKALNSCFVVKVDIPCYVSDSTCILANKQIISFNF